MRLATLLTPTVVGVIACAPSHASTAAATSPPTRDCESVRRRAVADSGAGPVSVYFTTADNRQQFPDSLAIRLARSLAREFKPPVIAQYPILGMHFVDGRSAYWGVTGTFNVVWHPDGRLTEPSIGATTLVPALDTAVLAALDALTEASAERRSSEGDPRDSVRLVVRLFNVPTPPISVTLYPQKFARRSITRPLRDSDGNGIQAWMRTAAPTATDTGFVTLWFVVDASGTVDPKTVQVLHRGTPAMMRALPAVVLAKPYQPSEVDGCPVATLVVRRVDFSWSR